MTPEGRKELEKIRAVRGYTLPVHDVLADLNPEFLRRYGDLASYVLFGPPEGRALDLKTRYLVLIGVTTAVNGDPEGIEWGVVRAMQAGASWDEVREAAFLAALPAGVPSFEKACRAFELLASGKGLVAQDTSVVKRATRGRRAGAAKAGTKAAPKANKTAAGSKRAGAKAK